MRTRTVAVVSFGFTYLFFLEYLRPLRRVLIPYDLENFHFPLVDYAFQALRHGRFPEWDATIYCGASFAGNIQAGLFYPPMWLVFLANAGHETLSYLSLQAFMFAHVWLGFLLFYVWTRRRGVEQLASALGAGVFAFSGYMLLQLQHQGLVTGCAWLPLGLIGIDEAAEERRWQPLWKLAAASALCFLAGYPPTWFVFGVLMLSYAAARGRVVFGAAAVIAFSLALAAVQAFPAWEANRLKVYEPKYGTGIRDPAFFISYLVPNYYDFDLRMPPLTNAGKEYLYLGAPAFLGLLYLVRRRGWRQITPAAAMLAVSAVLVTNPHNLVGRALAHSALLYQLCRAWYFLAGVTLAVAALAAFGLDALLKRPRRPGPRWLGAAAAVLLAAWAARQLSTWFPLGADFPAGWRAALAPAVTAALFAFGMFVLPGQRGALRTALTAAVLLSVAVDYKIYGTSKRFNASENKTVPCTAQSFPAMADAAYRDIRAHPDYRVAVDLTAPFPGNLRHCGLTTPQGFDPLLPAQYKVLVEQHQKFRTNWEFEPDPANVEALRLFGVRYYITSEAGPNFRQLAGSPNFKLLGEPDRFYKVYELAGAQPPYRMENGSAQLLGWTPERRVFRVRSDAGGRFLFAEQWFPGWSATVDGVRAPIARWNGAFQAVAVAPGEHRIELTFRSLGLRVGAAVSAAALALLVLAVRRGRISRPASAQAVPGACSPAPR